MEKKENRFMIDTSALNRIAENPDDEMMIYQSKFRGFEYYFTEIQGQESGNNIRNRHIPTQESVPLEKAEKAVHLLRIISKLQTRYAGQIATLRRNRWVLDGTFEILPDGEDAAWEMFDDILHNNDFQHYNDAMIALTAIVNGCTLVAEDRRLMNRVNKHFPGRAIRYETFIQMLEPASEK